MELQRTRLFLLISLFVVGFILYNEWQREHVVTPVVHEQALQNSEIPQEITKAESEIPSVSQGVSTVTPVATPSVDLIDVTTDVFKIKIDPLGGDIVRAELSKYPQKQGVPDKGVVLLDRSDARNYVAQSGLIGKDDLGPDSRTKGRGHYTSVQNHYDLTGDQLSVDLNWQHQSGVKITKIYTFQRGSYVVDVSYRIHNQSQTPWQGSFYGQLRQEYTKDKSSSFLNVQMYHGPAMSLPDKPYKKVSFSDMKKQDVKVTEEGGWAAMVEHYFLSAFIPPKDTTNNYYSRVDNGDFYNIGAVRNVEVAPNSQAQVDARFYIGPEVTDTLKQLAPGLDLTVDYGILWPISQALFWLLKTINSYIGNWGWSIIFVTLIIKILFYKLSAASYRSMGQMRKLQPRIELLKQRHGDDKQQFSVAMMELYKKEKINPLGGCLPILIQIPVFIALYYVLLASVELRQAPFILWIHDLSSKDPFYVLPLIMGATMFLQQKMNPPPPDPMQAKIMMLMPVVFTVLFLSFPAGLVLYWTVNNILSIAQQWYITRSLENDGVVAKRVK